MILTDSVTLNGPSGSVTVRAHVGRSTTGVRAESGQVILTNDLQVIIDPMEGEPEPAPGTHTVTWRGDDYDVMGVTTVTRRHGQDHHWTVPIGSATSA